MLFSICVIITLMNGFFLPIICSNGFLLITQYADFVDLQVMVLPADMPLVGIDRRSISEAIVRQNLSSVWSIDSTLRYMLISELLADAVWLLQAVGDWKSALGFSVLVDSHANAIKYLHK